MLFANIEMFIAINKFVSDLFIAINKFYKLFLFGVCPVTFPGKG